MRHFTKLLTGLSFVLIGAFMMAATAVAQDAKVLKKIGSGPASYTVAGGTPQDISTAGASIPVNATITTGAGAELYVEAIPGAIATIKENSVVIVKDLTSPQA